MRVAALVIAVALGLAAAPSAARARCLHYEPAQVNLEGTLTSKRFPGPPNYVSIARGDHPESVLILTLDKPACVSADPQSRTNSRSHAGITEVQLAVDGQSHRTLVGRHVRATGSLTARSSRHHRTPVVLTVKAMRGI